MGIESRNAHRINSVRSLVEKNVEAGGLANCAGNLVGGAFVGGAFVAGAFVVGAFVAGAGVLKGWPSSRTRPAAISPRIPPDRKTRAALKPAASFPRNLPIDNFVVKSYSPPMTDRHKERRQIGPIRPIRRMPAAREAPFGSDPPQKSAAANGPLFELFRVNVS